MTTPHNCPWCRAPIRDNKTKAGDTLPKYYGVMYDCGAVVRQVNSQVVSIHGCGEFTKQRKELPKITTSVYKITSKKKALRHADDLLDRMKGNIL